MNFYEGYSYSASEVNGRYPGLVPVGHSYWYIGRVAGRPTFQRVGGNDRYFA